jgi:uncharacterized protein (DUF924 family)
MIDSIAMHASGKDSECPHSTNEKSLRVHHPPAAPVSPPVAKITETCSPFPAPFELIEELVWDLVREWYGVPAPTLSKIQSLSSDGFAHLWTTLWFAKGPLQRDVDANLLKYGPLLEPSNFIHYDRSCAGESDGAVSIPELPPKAALLWQVGWMVAFDQVSRNIFRGTGRAYATDSAAFSIAKSFVTSCWKVLPIPVQVSVTLVYIHSENLVDFSTVREELLPKLQPEMSVRHPGVWVSLNGIAANHRDRMLAFGRVPERNSLLNRESSLEELAWIAAIRPI